MKLMDKSSLALIIFGTMIIIGMNLGVVYALPIFIAAFLIAKKMIGGKNEN